LELWRECVCATAAPRKPKAFSAPRGDGNTLPDGKVSIGALVVLFLFTFGIYPLIWYYKTTKFLRRLSGDDSDSVAGEFLLVMFVPFYSIYWHYKYARIIHTEMVKRGSSVEDFATMHLPLAVLVTLIAVIMQQSRINELVDLSSASTSPVSTAAPAQPPANDNPPQTDFSTKLRELSALRDEGLLTESDYEQKKKELPDRL